MDIYLVRHGDAKPEAEDPMRPLSDRGRDGVSKVGRAAQAMEVRVFEILHSDKMRARQTAEILARLLAPPAGAREIGGLAPLDDPLLAKVEVEGAEKPLMLVGHLPHLSRLASLLVLGDPEREVVSFPSAAMVCLSRSGKGWEIRWTLSPEEV